MLGLLLQKKGLYCIFFLNQHRERTSKSTTMISVYCRSIESFIVKITITHLKWIWNECALPIRWNNFFQTFLLIGSACCLIKKKIENKKVKQWNSFCEFQMTTQHEIKNEINFCHFLDPLSWHIYLNYTISIESTEIYWTKRS